MLQPLLAVPVHVALADLARCMSCLAACVPASLTPALRWLQAASSLTLEEGPEQDQQRQTQDLQSASTNRLHPAGSDPLPERAPARVLHRQVR